MVKNEEFIELMEKAKFLLRIKQKELSRMMGISESYLSGIKRGEKNAPSELLEKISNIVREAESKSESASLPFNEVRQTTKERLLLFLDYKGINPKRFEESTGMSNGWVNKVGFAIREENLKRLGEVYPELNISWLQTGVGNMIIGGENEETLSTDDNMEEPTATLVPLLPIAAQGGSLNDFVVSVKENECEKVVSPVKGVDFAMPVSGDSMAPEYPNGSQIFIKKINEAAFIEWGKAYVLDTCNGTVIKILVPAEKPEYVKCVSINKDPIYAPFEVAWKDIYGVYRVIICMSVK